MWRLFYHEDSEEFHLYDLDELFSYGYERSEARDDWDYTNEYYWIEDLGLRLASPRDFAFHDGFLKDEETEIRWMRGELHGPERREVYVHPNLSDYVIDAFVLVYRCGEDAVCEYEDAGFYTIEPRHSEENSFFRRSQAEVIDRLDLIAASLQVRCEVESTTDEQPGQESSRSDVQDIPSKSVRRIISQLGILEEEQLRGLLVNNAARVLKEMNVRGSAHTIRSTWCALGCIRCDKDRKGRYRIPIESLIDLCNEGPKPEGTFVSPRTPDPRKRPNRRRDAHRIC